MYVNDFILQNLFTLTTPDKHPYKLVRFGVPYDGGYVVPENICKIANELVTFGVGKDLSFEQDFHKSNPTAKITCYDGTIDDIPEKDDEVSVIKKNVGSYEREENGINIVGINDCITQNHTIVKMDIEGAENECLTALLDEKFNHIDCLILEVHFYFDENSPKAGVWYSYERLCDLLYKIEKHMSLVHIHGHNLVDFAIFESYGTSVPTCLELTFINKNLIVYPLIPNKEQEYPIEGLDFPVATNVIGGNYPKTENGDFKLTWINK